MTVPQYLECFPDKCSWLERLASDIDERLADLCLRLGYGGRASHLSATTCLLDDARILNLLPADGDLAEQMRMRLPELLVAREAYEIRQGFSPSPYNLLLLTSGRCGSGSLPPEAIKAASERRAAVLAQAQEPLIHDSIQCYPHDVAVSRIAVLGMSAAARVKLSSAESFTLFTRASNFMSMTVDREWTSDTAAHIAFLILSADYEWALDDDAQRKGDVSSPESAVSVRRWETVLLDMTELPQFHVRIAKARIVTAMGRWQPAESRPLRRGSSSHDANSS